jgi:hypothetical protein
VSILITRTKYVGDKYRQTEMNFYVYCFTRILSKVTTINRKLHDRIRYPNHTNKTSVEYRQHLLPVLKAIGLTIFFSCTPRALSYNTSLRSTMKVTSNLSFLLYIGTIAMPVVEASLNGFSRLKPSAATKPSFQSQDVFDFDAQQSHRGLKTATAMALLSKHSAATSRAAKIQTAVEVAVHQQRRSLQEDFEIDAASLAICDLFLAAVFGPNSGCACTDEEPSMECIEFIASNCLLCDTIQSEEACLVIDEEATLAALPETGSFVVDCLTYRSGPFADDTLCGIQNFSDNTCTFTLNETECTSCTVVVCDGEEINYDIDCSNIIAGETWNLCTDDIPETSPFIAFGDNDLFQELTCGDGEGVDFGLDSVGLALCQTIVDGEFGVDSGCVCEFDGEDFVPICDCVFKACDTVQGVEACVLVDEDAQLEAEARIGVDGIADCFTYESGPFADSTICLIEDFADSNACTITIDGKECNSCGVVTCSDTDGIGVLDESFNLDCSNVIAGESWSLCSDDIPQTSPFIVVGNNELFSVLTCVSADSDEPEVGESDGSNPGDESLEGKDSGDGGDMSGGVAASSHMLSLVGIIAIVVTSFW